MEVAGNARLDDDDLLNDEEMDDQISSINVRVSLNCLPLKIIAFNSKLRNQTLLQYKFVTIVFSGWLPSSSVCSLNCFIK